ncbi:unnamed protein product [Colias eurytheme]|nr:unnamed protein product [Colias eurytheme]
MYRRLALRDATTSRVAKPTRRPGNRPLATQLPPRRHDTATGLAPLGRMGRGLTSRCRAKAREGRCASDARYANGGYRIARAIVPGVLLSGNERARAVTYGRLSALCPSGRFVAAIVDSLIPRNIHFTYFVFIGKFRRYLN